MKTLVIETSKSLYAQRVVTIDGQEFKVRTITLDGLERIQRLGEDLKAGKATAARALLEAVLDGPIELLGSLTIAQVGQLTEFAIKDSAGVDDKEKNGSGPEPLPLP